MYEIANILASTNNSMPATGRYHEDHGIIGNAMFDVDTGKIFRVGPMALDPYFWDFNGTRPIWVSAIRQNIKSGVYFWPGSEVFVTWHLVKYSVQYSTFQFIIRWKLTTVLYRFPDMESFRQSTSSTTSLCRCPGDSRSCCIGSRTASASSSCIITSQTTLATGRAPTRRTL